MGLLAVTMVDNFEPTACPTNSSSDRYRKITVCSTTATIGHAGIRNACLLELHLKTRLTWLLRDVTEQADLVEYLTRTLTPSVDDMPTENAKQHSLENTT